MMNAHLTDTQHIEPIRILEQGPWAGQSALMHALLEDSERERHALFTRIDQYNHTLAGEIGGGRLLEIFDATFQCVRAYYRATETLFAQVSWPCFQRNQAEHFEIETQLAAFRIRLADGDARDAMECAHVFDGVLIHYLKEQPLSDGLG